MSIRELNLPRTAQWLNGWLELGAHGFIQVVWKSACSVIAKFMENWRRAGKSYDKANV